jgi:hypothetical protein
MYVSIDHYLRNEIEIFQSGASKNVYYENPGNPVKIIKKIEGIKQEPKFIRGA